MTGVDYLADNLLYLPLFGFFGQALDRSRTSPERASFGTRPAVYSLFFFFFGAMMDSDGADVRM